MSKEKALFKVRVEIHEYLVIIDLAIVVRVYISDRSNPTRECSVHESKPGPSEADTRCLQSSFEESREVIR